MIHLLCRNWILVLAALVHAWLFLVIFDAPGFAYEPYFDYASRMVHGELPYRDFDIEYPPLALVFFILPRLAASSPDGYQAAFAVEMLLFDLAGLMIAVSLARQRQVSILKSATVFTLALIAVGSIMVARFDIVPAVMTALALYAFIRGYNTLSWTILALAAMTKLYPLVIVPLLALYLLKNRNTAELWRGAGAFACVTCLVATPCLFWDAGGFYDSFTYHSDRGIQIESSYASALLLGDVLQITDVEPDMSLKYGSVDVIASPADILADASFLLMISGLGIVYVLYARKLWPRNDTHEMPGISRKNGLIPYAVVAVGVFMLTSKVFSPQFVIWLVPLVGMLAGRRQIGALCLLIAIGLMTHYIYPDHYSRLIGGESREIIVLFARNALLLGLVLWLAWPSTRTPLRFLSGIWRKNR